MKRCVYINLPAAEARRTRIETAFAAAEARGWELERFPALGPAEAADAAGALTLAEKGCFLSHRAVVERGLGDEAPLVVCEDDALFSHRAFARIDALLTQPHDWDLLFTDLAICDLGLMVQLGRLRDGLVERGEQLALGLAGRSFFGATAYVVRGSAKRALHEALADAQRLDQPYDLYLRDLCHSGRIKMAAAFPFLTTLAPEAGDSQIQDAEAKDFDRALAAWRRLMYVERDLGHSAAEIEALDTAYAEPGSRLLGRLFGVLAAPAFPLDR